MFDINGKYTMVRIYTDRVEQEAISQLYALCNHPAFEDSKIRIMPDVHAGAGCTIGTTVKLAKKMVIPNIVGVDIGCFTGDTKVWCSAGFYKTIKELAEKNEPFFTDSFDEETNSFVSCLATAFKTRENAELVEVTYCGYTHLDNPNKEIKIRCTPDHKFLTCYENNGTLHYSNDTFVWKEAKDLKVGTRLVAEDLNIVVKNVKPLNEREDVYCLNVPETHNFSITYGVIVHNCGVHTTIFEVDKEIDFKQLDDFINETIPSGLTIREEIHPLLNQKVKEKVKEIVKDLKLGNEDEFLKSIGTLGGGNHYIEIGKIKDNTYALSVHTGSRKLGKKVCEYFQTKAIEHMSGKDEFRIAQKEFIEELKRNGRASELSTELIKFKQNFKSKYVGIPKDMEYIEDEDFEKYMENMQKCQAMAAENRLLITTEIIAHLGVSSIVEEFDTIHNYIEKRNENGEVVYYIRKGAISAKNGEKLAIPLNMKDGVIIGVGKGNVDWNESAPYGAGRLLSRSKAKEMISLEEFEKSMEGINTWSVCRDTLDESPQAYKPAEEIVELVQDTIDILYIAKPIYNFKASRREKSWKKIKMEEKARKKLANSTM